MQMLLQVDDGKGSLMTVFIGELGRSDLILWLDIALSQLCAAQHTPSCVSSLHLT